LSRKSTSAQPQITLSPLGMFRSRYENCGGWWLMVCGLRNCERDGVPADDGEKVVVPPAIAPVVAQDKIIISESRLYNKQLMISSRPEAKASRGLRARRSRQGAPLPAPPYTLKRPHRHSERLPKAKTCANAFHLLKSRRTRRSSFFGRYSAPVAGTPS